MREDYRERFRILGLRIAYYRKMRGMTQEQFAEAIGRSVSFVSQIEANNAAEVKGVSLETLFLMSEKLPKQDRDKWKAGMLKLLDIDDGYYKSKYKEPVSDFPSDSNQNFAKEMEQIFR